MIVRMSFSSTDTSVVAPATGNSNVRERETLTDHNKFLGTPETGGWSTRELRTIIRGLEGINLIAADIVEVAPAYDTNAELTTMAAADTLYEVMTLMVKKGPLTVEAAQGNHDGEEL